MEYFSDEAWQADRVFDKRWQRLYEHFDAVLFDCRFSNFEFERDKTTFIVQIAIKRDLVYEIWIFLMAVRLMF